MPSKASPTFSYSVGKPRGWGRIKSLHWPLLVRTCSAAAAETCAKSGPFLTNDKATAKESAEIFFKMLHITKYRLEGPTKRERHCLANKTCKVSFDGGYLLKAHRMFSGAIKQFAAERHAPIAEQATQALRESVSAMLLQMRAGHVGLRNHRRAYRSASQHACHNRYNLVISLALTPMQNCRDNVGIITCKPHQTWTQPAETRGQAPLVLGFQLRVRLGLETASATTQRKPKAVPQDSKRLRG